MCILSNTQIYMLIYLDHKNMKEPTIAAAGPPRVAGP